MAKYIGADSDGGGWWRVKLAHSNGKRKVVELTANSEVHAVARALAMNPDWFVDMTE